MATSTQTSAKYIRKYTARWQAVKIYGKMQSTIRGDDVHNINAKIRAEPNSPEAR